VLSRQLGPQLHEAMDELTTIAAEAGWYTHAGGWRVPPTAVPRLRERRGGPA
jgi:hypothetical protein